MMPKLPLYLFVCSLAAASILRADPALAQSRAISVTGTVKDSSGGVLGGARVDATIAGLVVAAATTGADGRYALDLSPAAMHRLRVHMDGFADEIVDVPSGSTSVVKDFVLKIAGLADSVVVTAARLPERRTTSSESIDVVTAKDVAALGTKSLGEIVALVPGLSVEVNGREGSLASLFSRGGESDYNLVLIDGVRVNQSGGTFDFSRVSGAEIERVEVVRGAQSALYGSDAIGSVVQVITKRAAPGDPPEVTASLEGGTFNSWRGGARVFGGARRRIDYQLGTTYRGTEGAFQDLLPEHDTFRETTVDGGVGAILGDRATLRTGLRYATATGKAVGPIDYGSRDTGTIADSTDLSWHVDFTNRVTSKLDQQATFASYRSSRESADTISDPIYNVYAILEGTPGALFPDSPRLVRLLDQSTFNAFRSGAQTLGSGQFLATTAFGVADFLSTNDTKFRRSAAKYQADYNWAGAQTLSGGYDYERETDPLHPDFLVENHAFFVQQRLTGGDRMFATVGARVDRNSRYGTSVSPKAGAGIFVLPYRAGGVSSAKVFGNVGRGIKNPTFGELYGSAFTDGNPDLNPERARTVDAGIEATFDSQRVLARATYFNNAYNDQVAFKSSGPGLDGKPDYINIDGSSAKGLELQALLQKPVAGGLTASVGYALVDTRVESSVNTSQQFQPGQPLLRRPKHSATIRMNYSRGRGTATFMWRYVGERHDAAFIGLSTLATPQLAARSVDITVNPGYGLASLGGEMQIARGTTAFVRVDNLADASYENALGYPGLPRAIVAGFRVDVRTR
jgi:outer membrane cobalamin receptor